MEQQRNLNDHVKIALLSPGSILHVPFANRDTVRDSLKEKKTGLKLSSKHLFVDKSCS